MRARKFFHERKREKTDNPELFVSDAYVLQNEQGWFMFSSGFGTGMGFLPRREKWLGQFQKVLSFGLVKTRMSDRYNKPVWCAVFGLCAIVLWCSVAAAEPGLQARYYSGRNFETLAAERIDPMVDFSWNGENPPPGDMGRDNFSVRWVGTIRPRYSESYTFSLSADDGARVWINGTLVADDWTSDGTPDLPTTISLQADRPYGIKVEFYQGGGGASARLMWQSNSQPQEIVPTDRLDTEADFEGNTPEVTLALARGTTGEKATQEGRFIVSRWGSLETLLLITLEIEGDAVEDEDYRSFERTFMLPANRSALTRSIEPFDDEAIEGDENIVVRVVPGLGYGVGDSSEINLVIQDDELPSGDATSSVVGIVDGDVVGTYVVVVYDDDKLQNEVTRTARVAPGLYSIAGLAPGEYYAMAFVDENENGEHDGEELMLVAEQNPLMVPPDALNVDFRFTSPEDIPDTVTDPSPEEGGCGSVPGAPPSGQFLGLLLLGMILGGLRWRHRFG